MTDRMTIEEFRAVQKKKPKYRSQKAMVDGIEFDSKKEAGRYSILKLMEKAGGITDLKIQQIFVLAVNGKVVCRYVADFTYTRTHNDELVVEDCKGFRTAAYQLKRRLMKAIHGIEIFET